MTGTAMAVPVIVKVAVAVPVPEALVAVRMDSEGTAGGRYAGDQTGGLVDGQAVG